MAAQRLTQFDFHHTLAETTGVSLVYFTSPGCGACRRLKQLFTEQAEQFGGVTIFEVDAGQEMALTREFEVFHLPSMFLFNEGQFHAPLHAEPRPASIMAAVEEALLSPPEEAP